MVNHLLYTDDMVITSPSAEGRHRAFDTICVHNLWPNIDIRCNHENRHRQCMRMQSKYSFYVNTPVDFFLN